MYVPEAFRIADTTACHRVIRENSFALLVTHGATGSVASHLPFFLRGSAGPLGTLVSHLARANPQLDDLRAGAEALVIFQGVHGYVSPGWYSDQPAVPTWNYVAVHAYGTPKLIAEPTAVRAALAELVDAEERHGGSGWSIDRLPDDFFHSKTKGITLFELPIARLEGKAKLSQNRSAADRRNVRQALEGTNANLAAAMKDFEKD